jgi:hypothetical protein
MGATVVTMSAAHPITLPSEPGPASAPRATDPEKLRKATERLRALGIDDDVVFSSDSVEETMAYLGIDEPPCARGT